MRGTAIAAELQYADVKSLQIHQGVEALELYANGLVVDRLYGITEAEEHTHKLYKKNHVAQPGDAITQREDPRLANITTEMTEDGLKLQAEGHGSVVVPVVEETDKNHIRTSVWSWEGLAVDQGEEAGEWLSDFVGRPVKLVRASSVYPRYVEDNPNLGKVGFADGFPLTIASTISQGLMRAQLEAQGDVDLELLKRVRTTMILDGLVLPDIPGLPENAFPEDYIDSLTIAMGGVILEATAEKPCGRCILTSNNPNNGSRKGAPILKALRALGRYGTYADVERYGEDPELFYSQNFSVRIIGEPAPEQKLAIAKGAELLVKYTNIPNWLPRP